MSLNRNIEDGSVVILQNGAIFASLDGAGARNADGEEVFLSEAVKLGAEECSISVEDIAKLFQLKLAK